MASDCVCAMSLRQHVPEKRNENACPLAGKIMENLSTRMTVGGLLLRGTTQQVCVVARKILRSLAAEKYGNISLNFAAILH